MHMVVKNCSKPVAVPPAPGTVRYGVYLLTQIF